TPRRRVSGVQPVHRAVLGQGPRGEDPCGRRQARARRVRRHRPQPAGGARGALLQRRPHPTLGSRPRAALPVGFAPGLAAEHRRPPPRSRAGGRHPAPRRLARDAQPTRCGHVRDGRHHGCGTSGGRTRRGPCPSLPVTWLVTGGAAFVRVNLRGTLVLLEASRRRGGLRRFILASTGGAVLGDAVPPVHEGMPARPLSPYGASKLACEGYCSAYYGSYAVPTVALRFSNVYGPYSS